MDGARAGAGAKIPQFEPNPHLAGHNRCMAAEAASERETWWVLQAQSGSHEALNELFKSVQQPLFRYIVSLVRDEHLAEDILQEVFIRIYRKLRWLREPEAFRAWTYQIASREAFRYLNRERRWSEQVRDEETLIRIPNDEHEREFSRELVESLPQLVGNLSPASRAVVVLFYLHEMSLVETAAVLDIPVGTAKSRLAYGLACLRRSFSKEET
jgi:RNA polymerase sigma-70 factor (ECF subfamily)